MTPPVAMVLTPRLPSALAGPTHQPTAVIHTRETYVCGLACLEALPSAHPLAPIPPRPPPSKKSHPNLPQGWSPVAETLRKSAGLTVMGAYALVPVADSGVFKEAARDAAGLGTPENDQPSYGAPAHPAALPPSSTQLGSRGDCFSFRQNTTAGRQRMASGNIYGVHINGTYYTTSDATFPHPYYAVVTAVAPQSPANEARSRCAAP